MPAWGSHDLEGDFVFLDPPYDIKANLYGRNGEQHKGFSHDKFAEDIKKLRANFMITYNSNQTITDLFDTFTLMEWDLKYTMRSTGTYMKDQKERKASQYHIHKEDGQYEYGYNTGNSAKYEIKTADGITKGAYSYSDPNNVLRVTNYVSDNRNANSGSPR